MPHSEELDALQSTLHNLDTVLSGLADFRQYPELLVNEDVTLQRFLENFVRNVQDARSLSAKSLALLDEVRQGAIQDLQQAVQDAATPTERFPVGGEPVITVRPPVNMEQIFMANPTGMREVVLVADHDAESLQAVEEMLTDEDYRVLSVRDAFEAVSIYARLWAAIDLVILDFSMPGLSGDLMFDEFQAINPQVAAVVSGGYTHPDKLSQMLGRGLSGFLPKPFTREKLIRQIQQVMAHKPPPRGANHL